jgi:hypothetical protein
MLAAARGLTMNSKLLLLVTFLSLIEMGVVVAGSKSTDKQTAKRSKNSIREELGGKSTTTLDNCVQLQHEMIEVQKIETGVVVAGSKSTDKQMARRSKNSIREELGDKLKATLDNCVQLQREMIEVQKKVIVLQERLLNDAEHLFNGGQTHAELANALRVMTEADRTINTLVAKVEAGVHLVSTRETEA